MARRLCFGEGGAGRGCRFIQAESFVLAIDDEVEGGVFVWQAELFGDLGDLALCGRGDSLADGFGFTFTRTHGIGLLHISYSLVIERILLCNS